MNDQSNRRRRVLIAAPARSDRQLQILAAKGHEVVILEEPLQENLVAALPSADAVCLGILNCTTDMLESAPNLQIVARQGSGTDMVDTQAADRLGIWVTNTPGANSQAVAEFTVGAMIAAGRHLAAADARVKSGQWRHPSLFGPELKGRTAGLIGLGKIGRLVAGLCRAFEMTVIGYDPHLPEDVWKQIEVEEVTSLANLARTSDFILVHAILTEETHGLLSADILSQAKTGTILVNVARAELIDEKALLDCLDSGRIAAAVLDVFSQEPPTDRRLADHPSVIATPHIAAWTHEARERMTIGAAEEVVRCLSGKAPEHPVNRPHKPRNGG